MMYGNPEWHWSMMLGMTLFWIAVIVAIVFAVRYLASNWAPNRNQLEETPETILKRRYASGIIERDEYERRLADLRK